ncbi:biotin carboxylase [Paeniglutamicibacter sp. MACA_103]|uniref:biotin carboxylase n=1 Tax=Paeniglutamicibacter sp. MACA_103 TaxID=3377337 RepID=UPI0038930005
MTTAAASVPSAPIPVVKAADAAPKTTAGQEPVRATDKPSATSVPASKAADSKPAATVAVKADAKPAGKQEPAIATTTARSIPATNTTPDKQGSAAASQAATPVADPMPRATPTGPEAPEATIGTDAAFASTVPCDTVLHTLRNISEVRHFFRTNDVPVFFIGATPFNLLGLDRWVRNFTYVSYYDAWDGAHPRVFTPVHKPYREFGSGEEINNWLLLNAEVRARMTKDLRPGVRPKVAMVFFDEETEQICDELGYDLILPSAELRARLDSKIVTTELGNEAGVPSVPNVLTTGTDWTALRTAADKAGLGDELVVQTPYGDSGKTTFFINNESDWDKHSAEIVGEDIKVMRRINNLPVAVEAVLTRSGTLVGPFLTELAGHSDLTPYKGGWCGNEMHPDVLTDRQRALATDLVKRMGDRLSKEGYRGFFEVDVLVDTDTDEVYLGELNPRISGASAITNVTAGAYADVPLFLFHLLEYMDVEFDLDIDEINARWEALSGADVWSQMIIKETSETVELLTATPATGQYVLDASGALVYSRPAMDWHMLQNESEAFFLRIYGPGDYRWKGADLGILVTKGRLQLERNGSTQLTIRAKHFIDSVRAGFAGLPVGGELQADATAGIGVKTQW